MTAALESRIRKTLPMLGSRNGQEAIAALYAVNRLLHAIGKDWHWIAAAIVPEDPVEAMRHATAAWRRQTEVKEAALRAELMAKHAEDMIHKPVDPDTQAAAVFALAKMPAEVSAKTRPKDIATLERAAAGGTVNGYERCMIHSARQTEEDRPKVAEALAKRAAAKARRAQRKERA